MGDALFFGGLEMHQDAREVETARRKMKVQMARYLHLGAPDDDLGWGSTDVRELKRIYRDMADIIREEGTSAGLNQ